MKKCSVEIMKDIKKLEARKQSLLNKEARNSFSKYSENEEIKKG